MVKDIKPAELPKSDFSKKKNIIYENIDIVSQIENEAKKEEDKLIKQKKAQELKESTKRKQLKNEK